MDLNTLNTLHRFVQYLDNEETVLLMDMNPEEVMGYLTVAVCQGFAETAEQFRADNAAELDVPVL